MTSASPYCEAEAHFSPCGAYRYALMRRFGTGSRMVLFVGLNPSTADGSHDDPTIRRCVSFVARLGFDGLWMSNLFAFRATDPRALRGVPDPIGPDNDLWFERLAAQTQLAIVGWGNGGCRQERVARVLAGLSNVYCFGKTALGQPRHPLYLPRTTPLEAYSC
jgi:hypothetical protein